MSIDTSAEDFICNIGGINVDYFDLNGSVSLTFPDNLNETVKTPAGDVNILSPRLPGELTIPFKTGSEKFAQILGAARADILSPDGFIQLYAGLSYNLQGVKVMGVEEAKSIVESGDVVGQGIKFRIENVVQI